MKVLEILEHLPYFIFSTAKEPLPPPLPASKPPTLPFDQEVLQRSIAPRRTEKDFFIPRSNKILESNMDYRMAQPEETEYHPVTDEEPVSFDLGLFDHEKVYRDCSEGVDMIHSLFL